MANRIETERDLIQEYKQLVADWDTIDKRTAFVRMLALFAAYQTVETSYLTELIHVYKENDELKNKLKKHTYKRKNAQNEAKQTI